jgi:hypothetical protein
MRNLLLVVFVAVLIVGGLKLAGVRLPLLDYPIGPIGVDGGGPGMPNIQIEPPGFDQADELP